LSGISGGDKPRPYGGFGTACVSRPYGGVTTSLELQKQDDEDLRACFGIESEVTDFVTVRAGLQNNPNRVSAGFGAVWQAVRVDYSYTSHAALPGSHHFGLGVAFSMFTALLVTRWVFQLLQDTRILKKPLPMLRLIPKVNVNWMQKRYFFWGLSIFLVVVGIVSLAWQGRGILGIEFFGYFLNDGTFLFVGDVDNGGDRCP